jgi:pimeloyl-ACP methyl ester carboxylesterase
LCPDLGGEQGLADRAQAERDLADILTSLYAEYDFRDKFYLTGFGLGGEFALEYGMKYPASVSGISAMSVDEYPQPLGPTGAMSVQVLAGEADEDRLAAAQPSRSLAQSRRARASASGRRQRPGADAGFCPIGCAGDRPDRTVTTATALEILAECQIAAAMAAGDFDELPGRGQPLRLDDDSTVPPEWRIAFRVLRNSGMAPGWIDEAAAIRREVEKARARLTAVWRSGAQQAQAEANYAALNRRIARYNLDVPAPRWQIPSLDIDRDLQALLTRRPSSDEDVAAPHPTEFSSPSGGA